MPVITDADETWKSVTTGAKNETWQARSGTVVVDDSPTAHPLAGMRLEMNVAYAIPAGSLVYYRKIGAAPAVIARVGF